MLQRIFKDNIAFSQYRFSIANLVISDQDIQGGKLLLSVWILSILLFPISCASAFGEPPPVPNKTPDFAFSFQKTNSNAWAGEYLFEDVANWRERGPGGAVPSASYSLTISERSGRLFAKLEASGFQLNDSYNCTAEAVGDRLNIFYQSVDTNDGETNSPEFKRGQLLMSLVKTPIGSRTKYLYVPAAYKIYLFGNKKKKIYFSKS